MKILFYTAITSLLISLSACTKNGDEPIIKPQTGTPNTFSISKLGALSDNSFNDGDKIGLYIVGRSDKLTTGTLKPTGNLFDNKRFTSNSGVMNADVAQTYPAGVEWVDMYGYAPYLSAGINSNNKILFTIQTDQSPSLTASDLLWVARTAIQTTAESPELIFSHKLTKVVIQLTAGVGVTLTNPIVKLNNTLPTVELNIQTGAIGLAQGITTSILPRKTPSTTEFQAIIVPQRVTSLTNFITITNGSKTYTYTLPEAKNFESGKMYNYDITVNTDDLSVKISGSMQEWGSGDTTTGDAS